MNSERTDFNKIALIRKLQILRELEMKKPINEIDTDFIDEINLFGLELKGLKATLTPEEVEEKVRKIPFVEETATLNTTPESVKGRSTKVNTHKILLIAAIISILVAIFTISSIAFDWNIFDELKNRFGTVAEAPVNEEIDVGGVTVISRGEIKVCDTVEDAIKYKNIDVLYPTTLPDNVVIEQIVLDNKNGKDRAVFKFDDSNFTYTVVFGEKLPIEILSDDVVEIRKINNIKCYIIDMPDISRVQVYFLYNNDLYMLRYNDKQGLVEVIENLKELE